MRAIPILALALAIGVAPATARAQSNEAIAEQLFLEGQRLLEAGKTSEACERLAMSQHLDPATGTLVNLALCHEREGRTATAWSEYEDAAVKAANAGQRDREGFARQHAEALARELTKVHLVMASPAEGTTIRLDGAVMPPGIVGTVFPIDPGEHALRVDAPGKKAWQRTLHLPREASVTRVEIVLADAEAAPAPIARAPSPESAPRDSVMREPAPSWTRPAAYVSAGVGVAVIAVGAALLVRASRFDAKSDDEASKARLESPPNAAFKEAALSDHSAAVTNQTVGLVVGGVGIAALGAGVLLYVTSREPQRAGVRVVPEIGRSGAGIGVIATF